MSRVGLGVAVVLAFLVGGCAPVANPPAPSDTAGRAPSTAEPSNFASPTDMLQRYPTMRHQQL